MNESKIPWENRGEIKALKTDINYLRSDILEIKNNHLVHIAADISKIKETLGHLKITDSKQEPIVRFIYDIIKYAIFGFIGAGIALAVSKATS